jgi:hypothetical protein
MKKIICFDLDNVICLTTNKKYHKSIPYKKKINFINKLYEKKYYIIIFTARFMGRNKENVKKAKQQGYDFTKRQLRKWGLKYNKLLFGKPSYDIFVDDKALFFKKNWEVHLKKHIL